MSRPCAEDYGEACENAREKAEEIKAVDVITNTERLSVLKSRPDLLAEIDGVIIRNRLHNELMNLAIESVESGDVKVESVEDLETLLYLELLLAD